MRHIVLLALAATACGREVHGTVTWDDGTPAVGVHVLIVAPNDDVTDVETDTNGEYATVVDPDAFGVVAVTDGAASAPAYFDDMVVLRPSLLPFGATNCDSSVFGASVVTGGGDIEIRYKGTIRYVYAPFSLPNLRWAGGNPAERGPQYGPDPNSWDRKDRADSSGWKTLTVLIPTRYRLFTKYVWPWIDLPSSVKLCAR